MLESLDGQDSYAPFNGVYFTWIYITNASNHNVGFYDYEMKLNGVKLNQISPRKEKGTNVVYVMDGVHKTVVATEENVLQGNIKERSRIRLPIACINPNGNFNPGDDEVEISIKIIKVNPLSLIPLIKNSVSNSVKVNHIFNGSNVKDNAGEALLDNPIIKRI